MHNIDYRTLSDANIAGIVEANRAELHAGCLTAEDILKELKLNRAIIHRSHHGFYIIQLKDTGGAYLWILYVDPAHRRSDCLASITLSGLTTIMMAG